MVSVHKGTHVLKSTVMTSPTVLCPTRSPSADPGASQKSGKGVSNSRPSGLSKFQVKLMEMEKGALNLGLNRTHLTPNRLSVALSVILTAKVTDKFRSSMYYCRQ